MNRTDRRPSLIERAPDWVHGALALFVAGTSALIGSVLL